MSICANRSGLTPTAPSSVIHQYLSTVKPMHNAYVEPTKVFADIILNGGKNEQAFMLAKTQIAQLLREQENA